MKRTHNFVHTFVSLSIAIGIVSWVTHTNKKLPLLLRFIAALSQYIGTLLFHSEIVFYVSMTAIYAGIIYYIISLSGKYWTDHKIISGIQYRWNKLKSFFQNRM